MAGMGELGIHSESDTEIPMRDGVVLRANLWRPAGAFNGPAIVTRTPYGKPAGGFDRYVRAGYAVVAQDVRGRYTSDGEFRVFTDPGNTEGEDGYDTVEWVAAQPWCNGCVGTMGTSYPAWLQWELASRRPPHLLAMCACSIPPEATDVDWWGAFRPGRRINWWLNSIAPDLRRRAGWPPPHTPAEARHIWDTIEQGRWLGLLPWIDIARHLPPPLDRFAREWLLDPGRKRWRFAEAHAEIEVPNFDVTGWYDHCFSLMHLPGMQRSGRTVKARRQTRAIVGPYAHNTLGKRVCNDVDFGRQAELDLDGMKIRWFDHWLKGVENGVDREPPVRYFVMGSCVWKHAETWPPPGNAHSTFYLGGGGHANGPSGDGTLRESASSDSAPDRYSYDPRDPVPTLWTRALFAGASDRRQLDYRRDNLVYRTPPLERDIEIAGEAEVVLYAATSAPDTDFFARLIDEIPDGPATEVAYGMVRARHRESLEHEDFAVPGQTVVYRIRLTSTAVRFLRGHRIRLDITSSDFPNFDRNNNTGKNDLVDSELLVAEQTVYHDAANPSCLVLPGAAV